VFAAVVVGGTRLGGGRGGLMGSILGAYILTIMVNILLVLNVSAYVSTIAEGAILVLAALAVGLGRDSVLVQHMLALLRRWLAHGQRLLWFNRSMAAMLATTAVWMGFM